MQPCFTRVSPIYESWGWAELLIGEPLAALHHLDVAIGLEPRLASAHELSAQALDRLGNVEEAVKYSNQAVARSPSDAGMWKACGHEHLMIRDWLSAADAFDNAVKINTMDFDAGVYPACVTSHFDRVRTMAILTKVFAHYDSTSPIHLYARRIASSDSLSCS